MNAQRIKDMEPQTWFWDGDSILVLLEGPVARRNGYYQAVNIYTGQLACPIGSDCSPKLAEIEYEIVDKKRVDLAGQALLSRFKDPGMGDAFDTVRKTVNIMDRVISPASSDSFVEQWQILTESLAVLKRSDDVRLAGALRDLGTVTSHRVVAEVIEATANAITLKAVTR